MNGCVTGWRCHPMTREFWDFLDALGRHTSLKRLECRTFNGCHPDPNVFFLPLIQKLTSSFSSHPSAYFPCLLNVIFSYNRIGGATHMEPLCLGEDIRAALEKLTKVKPKQLQLAVQKGRQDHVVAS